MSFPFFLVYFSRLCRPPCRPFTKDLIRSTPNRSHAATSVRTRMYSVRTLPLSQHVFFYTVYKTSRRLEDILEVRYVISSPDDIATSGGVSFSTRSSLRTFIGVLRSGCDRCQTLSSRRIVRAVWDVPFIDRRARTRLRMGEVQSVLFLSTLLLSSAFFVRPGYSQ
jgi:hypothetical protein